MKESKLIKGALTTIAVALLATPAISVADEFKGRAEKVSFSDLNVDKEEGVSILYRRLQQASKRVCGVESMKNAGGIREISQQQRCYRATLDNAVAKVDNPVLTKLHES